MANEYLIRTSTSTGNRKVFTWSGWVKQNNPNTNLNGIFAFEEPSASAHYIGISGNAPYWRDGSGASQTWQSSTLKLRDLSSWSHFMFVMDTTLSVDLDRAKVYVNGILQSQTNNSTNLSINEETFFNRSRFNSYIGNVIAGTSYTGEFLFTDIFYIDGQALTPEVFGFYKDGNGYISAGSTQATDFRNGQWVPRTPREIKNLINDNGGFGVNGFYLPMNDSSNFGADFHTTPNSIITLKGENLPQPRNGAPETTDAYVSQLREDPYAANLVLAVPGISGGTSSGYGDYSADIKGSGSNKTLTANGNAGVAATASYYGSALSFDGTGDYFTVPNTADLRMGSDDFTIEAWVNKNDTDNGGIFGLYDNGNNRRSYLLYSDGSGDLSAIVNNDGTSATNTILGTNASTNLGTNQWHHCALEREGSYLRLYLNGVVAGIATDLSGSLYENTDDTPVIGAWFNSGVVTADINGYIQDLRVYKGVAKYKGGFDVPKPYTPVGIATWRAVPDTTANNFATLNPLEQTNGSTTFTFSEGNTRLVIGGSSYNTAYSTVGVTTGKYYFECRYNTQYVSPGVGANNVNPTLRVDNGYIYYNGALAETPSPLQTQAVGQIYGIALDRTNSSVQFYLNGSSYGSLQSISASNKEIFAHIMSQNSTQSSDSSWNFGQNPSFGGRVTAGTYTDSNGKGLFKYEPPSGFLALCEDNLPTPAIKNPGEHFKTVLWTGDGGSKSITGIGFTPDMVWVKQRNTTRDHHINDSVRGPGLSLYPNLTLAETSDTARIRSFDSDGFSIGGNVGWNQDGGTYAAWCWKAGEGTTATAAVTGQFVSATRSVNQDAGFAIINIVESSSTGMGTVEHGLGRTPAFAINKSRTRSSSSWHIWHKDFANTDEGYLHFNTSGENVTVGQTAFSGSTMSDTIYNYRNGWIGYGDGGTSINYVWAEIEGFSKFGSYVANNSTDGPFVYCGFKPAWVLVKNTTTTGTNWELIDNVRSSSNGNNAYLIPNDSGQEYFTEAMDFLSNGFKLRTTSSGWNSSSGDTYIFAAFAESPFTTANAK